MTIKTFDPNRVGGGTFQLEQDATGAYRIKEVGFVKLPDLKLPEIDQADYTAPPTDDDDTTTDPCPPGFKLVNGVCQRTETSGGGGGGGDNQIDFTGATQLRDIQEEATKFAGQDTGLVPTRDRTSLDQGAIKVEDIRSLESMPKAYQNLVNEYNRHQADVQQRNMTGSVNQEQALSDLMYSRELRNQINEMKGTSFVTKEGSTITAGRKDPEIIKAAPVISEDLQKFGPKTLTGATGVPDMIIKGQPSLPDQNIFSKAKDVVSNTKPVQLMGIGLKTATTVIGGALDAIVGVNDVDRQRQKNAISFFDNVSSKNYKTKGQLGSNIDPGRLAGNPSVDLFAGMNKVSAKGNLEKAGAKRIATRKATIAKKGIKSASNPNGVSQEFVDNTNNMEKELTDMQNHNNNENIKEAKKKGIDTSKLNPNEMRNVAETGDPGGDPGGKIVCTMMNQRYGFGSFRNKIWLKFHKDYSPEYQKGYHKVFLPLVNIAKKEGIFNTIVRKILEHMGRHVTADMFQVMRNKKSNKLGRVYRKIFEPICYWLGRK
jgi:hypothetical protein